MRLTLCAALLLLAGCTAPTDPASETALVDAEGTPSAADDLLESTSVAAGPAAASSLVARLNTSIDAYTGTWLTGVGDVAAWDAAQDLALPRPHGSLLFEMRCQQTGGTVEDHPGYSLRFEVVDGDATVITWASGDLGDCAETKAYDRTDAPRPKGMLTNVTFEVAPSLVNVEASYDVQFAISWFDAQSLPDGYSAFA